MATKRKNRAGLKKVFEVYYQGGYIGRVEAKTAGAALRKARFEWGSSGDIDTKKMKVKQLGQLYSNPRKVAGKSTTLRNMAFVSITKQRNGVVKITGRKMAPKRNGPLSEYRYQRKTGASKRMALAKAAGMYKRNPRKPRKQR